MIINSCGIINLTDAPAAIACGATVPGFNFYPCGKHTIGISGAAFLVGERLMPSPRPILGLCDLVTPV